jgi:hypothetical protein
MKTITTILLLCIFSIGKAQSPIDDYKLLHKILEINISQTDSLRLVIEPQDFVNQKEFFTKSFIDDYTYRTIGVDGNKVKKLIKKIDFDFLRAQTRDKVSWNLEKITIPVIQYNKNTEQLYDYKKSIQIAKPIYSKDKKFSFVYVRKNCGFVDCGSTNIYIYEQKGSDWKYYEMIPISLH